MCFCESEAQLVAVSHTVPEAKTAFALCCAACGIEFLLSITCLIPLFSKCADVRLYCAHQTIVCTYVEGRLRFSIVANCVGRAAIINDDCNLINV